MKTANIFKVLYFLMALLPFVFLSANDTSGSANVADRGERHEGGQQRHQGGGQQQYQQHQQQHYNQQHQDWNRNQQQHRDREHWDGDRNRYYHNYGGYYDGGGSVIINPGQVVNPIPVAYPDNTLAPPVPVNVAPQPNQYDSNAYPDETAPDDSGY